MTFVVTEACINCKHADCVEICPTEAFHEGANFIVINPDECIDCGLCVAECPVDAIFADRDLPDDQQDFTRINRDCAQVWPVIVEKKPALADAADWAGRADKRRWLVR